MSSVLQTKLGRTLLLLGLLAGLCVIAGSAARESSRSLLIQGPGQWVEYPHVARTSSHPERELEAIFTRELDVPLTGTEETTLRCLGTCTLAPIRAGATSLSIAVMRADGPPAMAFELRLRDDDRGFIESDTSWLVTQSGAAPFAARLTSDQASLSAPLPEIAWGKLAALVLAAAMAAIAWTKAPSARARTASVAIGVGITWFSFWWKSAGIEPGFIGFDFTHHVHYVRYILEVGTLPLPSDGVQTYQPPLFYLLSALWLKLLGLGVEAPTAPMALRALTFLLGVAHLAGIAEFLRRLLPDRREATSLALLVAAALPVHVLMMHAFANEVALAATSTWTWVALLRCMQTEAPTAVTGAVLGSLLGAALMSKLSALVLVPVVFGALVASHPKRVAVWLSALVATAFVSGGYYLRIAEVYGTPFVGNWDPAVGFAWWQDPGMREVGDYFRFGAVFSQPYFAGFHSVWDGAYSTLFADGLASGAPRRLLGPAWEDGLTKAALILSLVPALTFAVGLGTGVARVWRRPTIRSLVLAAALTAMAAAFIAMTLRVPSYAQAKASYWSPVFAVLLAAFALGADRSLTRLRAVSPVASTTYVAALLAWALVSVGMLWIDESAPRTLHSRAERALAVGATDRALAYYDAVPSDVNEAWIGVGRCRAARLAGSQGEARKQCAKALAQFPDDAGALFHSAQLARASGDAEQALALLEKMAVLAPQDRRAPPATAALASSLGRSERAVRAAREMLRFDPGSPKARALLKQNGAEPR